MQGTNSLKVRTMAKQKQTAKNQTQKQTKVKPTVIAEPHKEHFSLVEDDSLGIPIARLDNRQLSTVQLQAMATQTGCLVGNQFLQKVITQRQQGEHKLNNNDSQVIQKRLRTSSVNQNAELRIPDFIARLNQINSQAIRYRHDNNFLAYQIINQGRLTNFDRDMMRFIDDSRIIPLRFVNRDPTTWVDHHYRATTDIDDLLAGSITSFQLNLLHILTERFATPNYERRRVVFNRPHKLGVEREREHLRSLLRDNTIRYISEGSKGPGKYAFIFRSSNGYRIEHLFSTGRGEVLRGSEVFVVRKGERVTLQQFINRRQQQREHNNNNPNVQRQLQPEGLQNQIGNCALQCFLVQCRVSSVIGYVGLNPRAYLEARALKSHSRDRIITSLDSAQDLLSTRHSREDFVLFTLGIEPSIDFIKFMKSLICLENCDPHFREQMADMMKMFHDAELGKYRLERLVLSGHHAGQELYGESNYVRLSELNLERDLSNLTEAFPTAASQVEDVMFSACFSTERVELCKSLFPNLRSAWVYEGYSPSIKQGSRRHIVAWERSTRNRRTPTRHDRMGNSIAWTKEDGWVIDPENLNIR